VKGETAFAHSLAVVEDGVPVAGVVYLPAKDRLYAAARGQGATLNGSPIGVAAEKTDVPRMLTTRPNVEPVYWPGGVPEMQRHFRPSLAYRMALVAEGRFDGMLTFRDSWEWDIAAGVLLCAEAGATVTEARGTPLRFNSERGMVAGVLAAAPGVHARLLARM
jgi:myo-inositol-1(or 4)-monophosphatase